MKNLFQLFLFSFTLVLVSCHYVPKSKSLEGVWKYERVEKNELRLLTITENDFLKLNPDGSFSYKLFQAGREGEGSWKFNKPNVLELTYNNPDTVRIFTVNVLTDKRLEFQENDVVFKLNKQ